jgi:NAD+ diphosphatase
LKNLGFTGGVLDRADPVRTNSDRLAAAFADPAAARLVLEGLDPVLSGDQLEIEPLPPSARVEDHVLLGTDGKGPIFVRLNSAIPHGSAFAPKLWDVANALSASQLALYGTARSLLDWHARHRFCSTCGRPTRPEKGGWARRCDSDPEACGSEHFPRVDPVAIMLAEHDGRVLLGRQPRFPAGFYSALAGFIEPGETIEEAVARELWEEAGIRVSDVRYVISQPWPFPSSLMIGCIAQAAEDVLTLDMTELDDAIWVDAAGVRAALAGAADAPFIAPPSMAVARHLLEHWAAAQP